MDEDPARRGTPPAPPLARMEGAVTAAAPDSAMPPADPDRDTRVTAPMLPVTPNVSALSVTLLAVSAPATFKLPPSFSAKLPEVTAIDPIVALRNE